MLTMDERNQLFLATHPDVRRKIRAEYRKAHPPVIVMAIKPKYAKAIYEGRKNWEFRKAPPPIFREIYVYESAPVSRITGRIMFCTAVTGVSVEVMDIVKRCRSQERNLPGIPDTELKAYAGGKPVTALRVYKVEKFERDVALNAKPPQNWGRFAATYRDTPKEEGDSHD